MACNIKISSLNPKNSKVKARYAQDATLAMFCKYLNMGIMQARYLLRHFGVNYIYTHTGLAVPYSDGILPIMVRKYGAVVVMGADGTLAEFHQTISAKQMRANAKKERRKVVREQERLERAERESIREERRRERWFTDQQTKPCPKRGGKGNSLEDIGRYNYVPQRSVHQGEYSRFAKYSNTRTSRYLLIKL